MGKTFQADTEAGWLSATSPHLLRQLVGERATPRQRQLIAAALSRREAHLLDRPEFAALLALAERMADASVPGAERRAALDRAGRANRDVRGRNGANRNAVYAVTAAVNGSDWQTVAHTASWAVMLTLPADTRSQSSLTESKPQADYIRDIVGNPFRPVAFAPAWRTSTALALAQAIYDDRAFDRLPILADALQDAGCEDEQVLSHCRGAGPHVRGCWVVDGVLGNG